MRTNTATTSMKGTALLAWSAVAFTSLASLLVPDTAGLMVVVALVSGSLLAVTNPAACLVLVLALSTAGGSASVLSGIAVAIALGAGAVRVLIALLTRSLQISPASAFLMLLLLWLAARFISEGSVITARTILACAAILFLTQAVKDRGHSIGSILTHSAVVFALLTAASPLVIAQGARFAGFSGNPNRMVFALLVFLPFLLMLFRHEDRRVRFVGGALSAATAIMIALSGSSQGVAGIAVIALCALITVTRGWQRSSRRVANVGIVVGVAGATAVGALTIEWSDDLLTLSDRVPIFSAAFDDFLRNPWLGSGLDTVSFGDVVERSPHSVILALFASGGILAGTAWLVILVVTVAAGVRRIGNGDLTGAVMLAFATVQFVQTVQFLLITWAVLALAFERESDDAPCGEGKGQWSTYS